MTNPIAQPPSACMTAGTGPWSGDLAGWPEGRVTRQEWLDSGGPLDAPDRLPAGGAWGWHSTAHDCAVTGGSVQRAGALA